MRVLSFLLVGLLWSILAWAGEVQLPTVLQQTELLADFDQPTAIAVSKQGQVFVLDGMNSQIIVFGVDGKSHWKIDKLDIYKAVGLSWAEGKLYIADTAKHRILVITETGEIVREIDLPAMVPERYWPEPVATQVIYDSLIYTDRRHHRFCLIDLSIVDSVEQRCFGERGEQPGEFQYPYQIGVDKDDYLHIVDVINGRVQVFNSRGQYFLQEGEFAVDVLYRPNGITIDAEAFQYVSDAYLGTVAIFKKGQYIGVLKNSQGKTIQFSTPVGLASINNTLFIVDATTNKVHKLELSYSLQDEATFKIARQSPDMSRKNCVACHFSWGFTDDKELKDKQGVLPVASLKMCYSCHHGVVFESRQAIPHGGQHPTLYDPVDKKKKRQDDMPREDDIPEEHPMLEDGEVLCTTCHTPHNAEDEQPTLYVENENSWMRIINKDSELCENCHESNVKTARERDEKKRGINHPVGFKLSKAAKGNKSLDYSKDPHLQKGLPKSFLEGGAMLGGQNEMVCQSCHQIHGGEGDNLVAVTDDKGEMCGECHKRQSPDGLKGARKAGVHPVNVKLEEPVDFRGEKTKKVMCQSCHSVHDGTVGTPLFPDKIKEAEKLCVDCHERQHAKDTDDAKLKGIHPMNEDLEEAVKIGEQKVKQMGCLSCHSIHSGKPNTPALIEEHQNGKLCENCHEGMQQVVGSDHDFRVTAKKSQNQFEESPVKSGVCGSCHSLHRGEGKQPYLNAAVIAKKKERDDTAPELKVDELCLNCHQEDGISKDKPIVYYGHPYKDITLLSDPEIMPLLKKADEKIEKVGVIACITCHEPHTWKPKAPHELPETKKVADYRKQENVEGNALNSFLRKKGVKGTFCVDCHNFEGLTKYKYFHNEKKARGIGIDYLQ